MSSENRAPRGPSTRREGVDLALKRSLLEHEQRIFSEIFTLERRASFLREASAILSGSEEESAVIENFLRLALSRWADWCVLDLVDSDGELCITKHVRAVKELIDRGDDHGLDATSQRWRLATIPPDQLGVAHFPWG